jgi:predicted amidophosphoribosyltransferase
VAEPFGYTEPYLQIYRPVPRAGPGVCRVCHSGPGNGQHLCPSCLLTTEQVTKPTMTVVPISLYRTPGPLWQVLRAYKDGPAPARAALTTHIAAVIARFTGTHLRCLDGVLGGAADLVTTVPSTRADTRRGAHPLQTAVRSVASLARLHAPLLTGGPAAAGHGQADDRAFRVTQPVHGARVLVIDDTFTTGARAQSAASALHLTGAAAVAVLTIGRVIWPEWNDNCRHIWDRACERPFTFERCCLCQDR